MARVPVPEPRPLPAHIPPRGAPAATHAWPTAPRGALPWGPAVGPGVGPCLWGPATATAAAWAPPAPHRPPREMPSAGNGPVLRPVPPAHTVNPHPALAQPGPSQQQPPVVIFYLKRSLCSHFIVVVLSLLAMYRLLQGVPGRRGAPCPGWCVAPARCPRPGARDVRREARREAGPNSTKQVVLRQWPPLPMPSCAHPAASPWCPQPGAGSLRAGWATKPSLLAIRSWGAWGRWHGSGGVGAALLGGGSVPGGGHRALGRAQRAPCPARGATPEVTAGHPKMTLSPLYLVAEG